MRMSAIDTGGADQTDVLGDYLLDFTANKSARSGFDYFSALRHLRNVENGMEETDYRVTAPVMGTMKELNQQQQDAAMNLKDIPMRIMTPREMPLMRIPRRTRIMRTI